MGPLGTRRIDNRPIDKNSTTPYINDFPSLPDECNDTAEDEPLVDIVPREDNDAFDTQVVDFDNETQPMDLCEDTQILYLAGETQIMDDFDIDEHMDTQLIDVSDDEADCGSDGQGAERHQLLHDSKDCLGRGGDQAVSGEEKGTCTSKQDKEARTDTFPSDHAVPSSGSLRKGFTAIRTASLRAASLAAQKKFSEYADHGSHSTEFGSRSSNLQCLKDIGGISDVEEHDVETDDEKGLSNRFRSKVARSLAKELFMEEDVADEECDNSRSREMTGLPQLPACETEVAGLSYVDSQEPGELSQANALEFVDRFLKINVLDPDQYINDRNATGEMVSPGTIANGPQSLAQQANRRSSLGVASAFDWDDTREDEGGGEFFTKKKDVLFGTTCGARKSCMKPQNSQCHGPNGSQSVGKLRNEKEQQNIHDKIMGLVHSDSKLLKNRKAGQLEEINNKADNYPDGQLGLATCNGQVLKAAPNPEPTSMLDVGIDTQMAAEAMEALSTGSALMTNNGSIGDEDHQNVSWKTAAKRTLLKENSVEKRSSLSRSEGTKSRRTNRVTMKSGDKTKSSVAFRTRSQYTVEEFNIDFGKAKVKRRRLPVKNISAANEKESSDGLACIDGRETVFALEGKLNDNGSLELERQSLQDVASVSTPARASGTEEVISLSIARKTRSKRTARCSEFPRDVRGLHSQAVVSSEDACHLSFERHQPCSSAVEGEGPNTRCEGSPVEVQKLSSPANITPLNLKTPSSAVSPLCVGDGYPTTPSCKGKRSLKRELYSLTACDPKYTSPSKDLRQRRDFSNVRVLFSQHLDDDIIRKQKKILSRLGVPVASSISDATHFVADMFVRTRNMLEAIACGKPVVTPLWLVSCGQSNCFIDEKNYILRDSKKEKELGFNMPNSLARASHFPLLEGRRVLITPKVKPSKEIVSGLVKAVRGQGTERLCRTLSNNDRLPDDLLVLSCEEDFQECLPLLEKGIAIYSSELLLNGIITQRLDYERYRIFADHVKRTRSTLWVKKNGDQFHPVAITK